MVTLELVRGAAQFTEEELICSIVLRLKDGAEIEAAVDLGTFVTLFERQMVDADEVLPGAPSGQDQSDDVDDDGFTPAL